MNIRVATWNIAAARKLQSAQRFDYSPGEELKYFAEQLRAVNPDVICLQESQTNDHDSLSKRLAESLNMPYVSEIIECPSHIDREYNLSMAVLSRQPFQSEATTLLPKPQFELKFTHNGKVVPPYDRFVQTVSFEQLTVANMHTEPLVAFGRSYDDGAGKDFAHEIDLVLRDQLKAPLVFAADFNVHETKDAFPLISDTLQLRNALPDEPTKPGADIHPDHILYSPPLKPIDAGIIQTQSDHFLCWAEFSV